MIRIYFGSPGAGKTTQICKHIKNFKKKSVYEEYYSNVETTFDDVHYITSSMMNDLGTWTPRENAYFAIDEAGIQYNNRKFKTLSQDTIELFKLHRHYKVDVDVFSQSWEDMDVTIRRLAGQLWYMRGIGRKFGFTLLRRVYKTCMVDDTTHQIIDGYRMEKGIWLLLQPLRLLGLGMILPQLQGWKLTIRLPYYKYFDTYCKPQTPVYPPYDLPVPIGETPATVRRLGARLRTEVFGAVKTLTDRLRSFAGAIKKRNR